MRRVRLNFTLSNFDGGWETLFEATRQLKTRLGDPRADDYCGYTEDKDKHGQISAWFTITSTRLPNDEIIPIAGACFRDTGGLLKSARNVRFPASPPEIHFLFRTPPRFGVPALYLKPTAGEVCLLRPEPFQHFEHVI